MHVILLQLFFGEVLELPDAFSLALGQLGVCLFDNDDIWELVTTFLRIVLVVFQLLHVQLI